MQGLSLCLPWNYCAHGAHRIGVMQFLTVERVAPARYRQVSQSGLKQILPHILYGRIAQQIEPGVVALGGLAGFGDADWLAFEDAQAAADAVGAPAAAGFLAAFLDGEAASAPMACQGAFGDTLGPTC